MSLNNTRPVTLTVRQVGAIEVPTAPSLGLTMNDVQAAIQADNETHDSLAVVVAYWESKGAL